MASKDCAGHTHRQAPYVHVYKEKYIKGKYKLINNKQEIIKLEWK